MSKCQCPKGMSYHANNCPVAPGELRRPATHYTPPMRLTSQLRATVQHLPGVPAPDACLKCRQPLAAHRSRHSADTERRLRCPKQVT